MKSSGENKRDGKKENIITFRMFNDNDLSPKNRYPHDVCWKGQWVKAQDLKLTVPEMWELIHSGDIDDLKLSKDNEKMELFNKLVERAVERHNQRAENA